MPANSKDYTEAHLVLNFAVGVACLELGAAETFENVEPATPAVQGKHKRYLLHCFQGVHGRPRRPGARLRRRPCAARGLLAACKRLRLGWRRSQHMLPCSTCAPASALRRRGLAARLQPRSGRRALQRARGERRQGAPAGSQRLHVPVRGQAYALARKATSIVLDDRDF
jgi:hypothetical protein